MRLNRFLKKTHGCDASEKLLLAPVKKKNKGISNKANDIQNFVVSKYSVQYKMCTISTQNMAKPRKRSMVLSRMLEHPWLSAAVTLHEKRVICDFCKRCVTLCIRIEIITVCHTKLFLQSAHFFCTMAVIAIK